MSKRIERYSNPERVVRGGLRRATKKELKRLGYSTKSILFTGKDVKNPTKFLTRAEVRKVQEPIKREELAKRGIGYIKKERIRALKRKRRYRYEYAIYSNYLKPITLSVAKQLTIEFLDFLKKEHNPTYKTSIGVIYTGVEDSFGLQPILWQSREDLIIDDLERKIKKYKQKMRIVFILGWIEKAS